MRNSSLKVCFTIALFLNLVLGVQANATEPPTEIWLTFEYEIPQQPKIQGVQVVGCTDSGCEQTVLLQQYGSCDSSPCLTTQPEPGKWINISDCTDRECHFASHVYSGTEFKLIVQFSDQVRVSDSVSKMQYLAQESRWRVTVRESDLDVTRDQTPREKARRRFDSFLLALTLTLISELVLAAIYLRWRVKSSNWIASLAMVFLINLATLPVVWFFFPALGRLKPAPVRGLGAVVLIVASMYATMLVLIYRAKSASRRKKLIIISVLVSPIAVACAAIPFISSFLYNNYQASPIGLPVVLILPLSELFAVACEAVLVHILSQGKLSLRHAGELSVLMNAGSFILGLWVIGF